MREEKDALGTKMLPENVYYGIGTQRALDIYTVSEENLNQYPELVYAVALVKKACAITNCEIKALGSEKADAIVQACDELVAGKLDGNFPLCIYRGSGTPLNMAVNEVLANRANEILTGEKGYDAVNPNTHVNMCQSSNDVIPTAKSITVYQMLDRVLEALPVLEKTLEDKAEEFADVVKMGRTCLQDAVPITLGQEFSGYHTQIRRGRKRLEEEQKHWNTSLMGGTAVGTGMGCMPGFADRINKNLSKVCGREIVANKNFFDAMQSADPFIYPSANLQAIAICLAKIAIDLKIMGSGPRAGMGEIVLPAAQPGSSIMPGKVNPVIPDMMIQIGQKVSANHAGLALGIFSGELDYGPTSAVPIKAFFSSCSLLYRSIPIFTEKVLKSISVNIERCRMDAEKSTSLATMVSALFGYPIGSKIAKIAYEENISCKEAALREKLLSPEAAEDLFNVLDLTDPRKTEFLFRKYAGIRKV